MMDALVLGEELGVATSQISDSSHPLTFQAPHPVTTPTCLSMS